MNSCVPWKWTGAISAADGAALETALRMDGSVTVITLGPADAEPALREALACGASRVVRIDGPADLRSDAVAGALAPLCRDAHWVVCGDASADRGSGSVPAFLAAELGIGQALGLVAVDADRDVGSPALRVVRRLDGGRREVLVAEPPAVLSVEGSVARLRRASLPAELAARDAVIDVVPGPAEPREHPVSVRPYSPRPREVAAPHGDAAERIRELAATASTATGAEIVTLDPAAAAARILDALSSWGYLGRELSGDSTAD